MAEELHLEADDDHVQRLAHEGEPVRAVVELIWNALDAEADNVAVIPARDEMDAITRTTVIDDGHWISIDELPWTFGRIGGYWKRLASKTKYDKRGLHGERGQGRLRVFALGSRVEWSSVGADTAGTLQRVEVRGSTQHRYVFPWGVEAVSDASPTGTVVTAYNESQKSQGKLEPEHAVPVLRSHFAPALMNEEGLTIMIP
jgi:hypothetical protein